MATAGENGVPKTGLRLPSKVQIPTKIPSSPTRNGLRDLNDAATNSRGALAAAAAATKHKPSNRKPPALGQPTKLTAKVPEPAPKRKSLQERAVEPRTLKSAAPSTTRTVNASVRRAVTAGTRGLSASTSAASIRPQTSASSYNGSASVSYGSRAQSAASNYGRVKPSTTTAHARSRSQYARPVTSMADRDAEARQDRQGGYPLFISTNPSDLPNPFAPRNRIVSAPMGPSKLFFSSTPTGSSPSRPSLPLFSTTPVEEEPADTDCADLTECVEGLSLEPTAAPQIPRIGRGFKFGKNPKTHIPKIPTSIPNPFQKVHHNRRRKHPAIKPAPLRIPYVTPTPAKQTPYLNRFTNDRAPVFDTESRMETMEREFAAFKQKMESDATQSSGLKENVKILETRVQDLEAIKAQLTSLNEELKSDLRDAKQYMSTANLEMETMRRNHTFEVDDLRRKYRTETEDMQDRYRKDTDRLKKDNEETAEKTRREFESQIDKLLKMHSEELAEMEKKLKAEVDEERSKRSREALELQTQFKLQLQNAGLEADTKGRELQTIQGELTNVKAELDRERAVKTGLQNQLTEATSLNLTLEASNKAMKEKISFLESDSQAQSSAFNELHRRMQEAIEAAELANEKLRQEETLRRKLHNQVQELKGNIRVMCRVRPINESEIGPAKIAFPDSNTDSKEVALQGPETRSAMGNVTTATYSYSFDRVFGPQSQNAEVFEEISQLVQSALDGYNVCIFCYGQTGSGKTHTMSSDDGMIPRATAQIYAEATRLEEKGWKYRMEGNFVEVYNETYNDLLGRSEDLDKKKLEVRHDPAKKQTTLENAVSVALDSPNRVEEMLRTASKNRSVAATKANMRSSRSHSVFILKLVGTNSITGERSEGTLNLVDLAGSERLDHSKAEGARLKETQNINKSLSCLGDVINALGSSKEGAHIPYRNSKLTYLLQYSLGGNSKTLMFVMVSPLQAHLQETVTSLKFATKVHNTHIGTAKKQTRA